MKVESIKFQNFRNLDEFTLIPCDGMNMIYGKNAQGKSNILEAIWLFCGGHSFRTYSYKDLVNFESDYARLDCKFFGQERKQRASITIESSKRIIKVNGVEKKTSSSLIEKFCAVIFSPDNMALITGGPSERRDFIDSAICREKKKNALTLQKYNRLLKQRNALLKELKKSDRQLATLSFWDEQLVILGAEIIRQRMDFVKMISDKAAIFQKGISKGREKLSLRYVSSVGAEYKDTEKEIRDKFMFKCKLNRLSEIYNGSTTVGPHRDDIEILINGKNAKIYGSQGQKRSSVLAIKLAEAAVLKERMGENPVILFDDVLSELDNDRQDYLLNELKGCQIFITCCEKSNKEQLNEGKVFHINSGKIID